jgi:hypothetical protein
LRLRHLCLARSGNSLLERSCEHRSSDDSVGLPPAFSSRAPRCRIHPAPQQPARVGNRIPRDRRQARASLRGRRSSLSRHAAASARTAAWPPHARRLLIEAAYHYQRYAANGEKIQRRQRGQPAHIINIAWRAQRRLNARCWQLKHQRRKPNGVVAVAIARELAGFCWEIALAD